MKKSILSLLLVGLLASATALTSCETEGCIDVAPTPSDTTHSGSRVLGEGTITDVSEIQTDEDAVLAFSFIEENQCVVLTNKPNGDIAYKFYEVKAKGTCQAKCVLAQAKPDLPLAQKVISAVREKGSVKITRTSGIYLIQ